MSDKLRDEARVLAIMAMQSYRYSDDMDFHDQVNTVYGIVESAAGKCQVCTAVRIELGGHPCSKLDGDQGLAAATMRELTRLGGRVSADLLKDSLPGYLKIEEDAAPDFWAEYADKVRERLRAEDALKEEG